MKSRIVLALALIALALAAYATQAEKPATEQDLIAADKAFDLATSQRGLDGWMEYMAEDVVALQLGKPLVGRDGMRESMARPLGNGNTLRWQPTRAELITPRYGYTVGDWQAAGTTPDGKKYSRTGRYLTLWRLQKDGTWKVIADGGS